MGCATTSLKESFKKALKKSPLLFALGRRYRRWEEGLKIRREEAYYKKRADELGFLRELSCEELEFQIRKRLEERGIFPQPKTREELHILYACRPCPWDRQNIVPALGTFSCVDTYYFSEYGFDDLDGKWVNIRDEMNAHLLEFVGRIHKARPIDLILTYLSGWQIGAWAIEALNRMGIVTVTFHLDDRLSFKGRFLAGRWSGPLAVLRAYDLNLTQARRSP